MKKLDRKSWAAIGFAAGLAGLFWLDWAIFSHALEEVERGLASGHPEAIFRIEALFEWLFFIGFLASSAIMAWGFWQLFREVKSRDRLEKELLEAKSRSENLARSRGEMLANVSHELRSPLGALLSFGQILSRSDLNERQKEALSGATLAAESLVRLSNDLLDLSKIEAGKMTVEARPFALRDDVLRSLEPFFEQKAAAKKINFRFEITPDTPEMLVGDPVRLHQILSNLLENAVKFTQRGYVFLLVDGAAEAEKGQPELRFLVKDTGDGIPPDRLERAFERFGQVGDGASRTVGAGLGLAIVRDLVEALGGSISVESFVGFGSTFSVVLPFQAGPSEPPERAEARRNAASAALDSALEGKKILLADDNELSQKLAGLLLEERGATVVRAVTGLEAFEILKAATEPFDLVLMDITMPELDGWAATHRIRTELKNAVPIIALTGWAQAGEREKCLAIGMDGYLSKPLRDRDLLREIMPFLPKRPRKSSKKPSSSVEKILNLRYLIDLSKGKKSFVHEMLAMFGRQAPAEILAIEKAVAALDHEQIRTAAHGLKSSAAYVGMAPAGLEVIDDLEKLAAEKAPPERLEAALEAVRSLIERAKAEAEAVDF